MPAPGMQRPRRPRPSPATRLFRALSWPRPGGIAASLAGAALVFTVSLNLAPVKADPWTTFFEEWTTANTASASVQPSATPAAGSGGTPSPAADAAAAATALPDATPPAAAAALPVAGAGAASPLQDLAAAGTTGVGAPALLDIGNPASPLVLVNKQRALVPADFAPADLVAPAVPSGSSEPMLLRAEAATALERMFADAAAQGVAITLKSSYRSYDTQFGVYNGYVADKGVAAADTTSARPGYSEHQTGLAVDIGDANAGTACDFNSCFADTAAAKWVAEQGADYGYIVRYLPDQEAMTGYLPEPWHLRFVGTAVAKDMVVRGFLSYEEFLAVPGAPDY